MERNKTRLYKMFEDIYNDSNSVDQVLAGIKSEVLERLDDEKDLFDFEYKEGSYFRFLSKGLQKSGERNEVYEFSISKEDEEPTLAIWAYWYGHNDVFHEGGIDFEDENFVSDIVDFFFDNVYGMIKETRKNHTVEYHGRSGVKNTVKISDVKGSEVLDKTIYEIEYEGEVKEYTEDFEEFKKLCAEEMFEIEQGDENIEPSEKKSLEEWLEVFKEKETVADISKEFYYALKYEPIADPTLGEVIFGADLDTLEDSTLLGLTDRIEYVDGNLNFILKQPLSQEGYDDLKDEFWNVDSDVGDTFINMGSIEDLI